MFRRMIFAFMACGAQAASANDIPLIDQSELLEYLAGGDNFTLIDARSAEEYAEGHVARAVSVPHDSGDAHLRFLPADLDAPLVVYCKSGRRSSLLRDALVERGYSNVRVLGPRQIFWWDTGPVFNCGLPNDPDTPASPIFKREE